MSSDESSHEDGHPIFVVKELPWRSESKFFEKLDNARDAHKTEQANRQTKGRVHKNVISRRPAPKGAPSWALKQ